MPVRRWVALSLVAAAAACGARQDAPAEGDAATITLVSVDTLPDESGELFGRFSKVLVATDSSIYVPIQYSNHVLHFDTDGQLLRRIGKHGSGPGEFASSPNALVEWGDSLAFVNLEGRQLSLFRRSDGAYLDRQTLEGFPIGMDARGSRLYVGGFSLTHGTVAGVLTAGQDSMRPIVPIPESVLRQPLAMRRWPIAHVAAPHADTVIVGFGVTDELRVATADGRVVDSLRIPALRRRAVPADIDAQLEPLLQSRLTFFIFAALYSLEQRPDGHLLAVHYDWFTTDSTDRPAEDGEMITEELRAYATLVDRAGRRACVDTPIPVSWTALPAISIHGNDIVVLGHLETDSDRPPVELRRYRIDLASCRWVPLG